MAKQFLFIITVPRVRVAVEAERLSRNHLDDPDHEAGVEGEFLCTTFHTKLPLCLFSEANFKYSAQRFH